MNKELIAQARLLARMSDLPTKQAFERLADRIEELEMHLAKSNESLGDEMTKNAALLADNERLLSQVEAWKQTAEQHLRNEQFYRELLDKCAFYLGPETFISDDGSVQDSPVRLKIPEMVAALQADNERLRDVLQHINEYWNWTDTEAAMYDALSHIDQVSKKALDDTPAQSLDALLGPYKAHIEQLRHLVRWAKSFALSRIDREIDNELAVTPAQSLARIGNQVREECKNDETVMPADEQIARLRRGNTALLEALMDMVDQFFYHTNEHGQNDEDGEIISHSFISAEEGAIAVLIDAGMAEEVKGKGYRLLWDKLEDRKPKYVISEWQSAVEDEASGGSE